MPGSSSGLTMTAVDATTLQLVRPTKPTWATPGDPSAPYGRANYGGRVVYAAAHALRSQLAHPSWGRSDRRAAARVAPILLSQRVLSVRGASPPYPERSYDRLAPPPPLISTAVGEIPSTCGKLTLVAIAQPRHSLLENVEELPPGRTRMLRPELRRPGPADGCRDKLGIL
jgi:hypothetical protein